MQRILTVSSLLLCSVTGFQAPFTRLARSPPLSAVTGKLSDVDLMVIENVAQYCLEMDEALANNVECDLDEHEALVNQLQQQREILASQVDEIDGLLAKLQPCTGVNGDSKGYISP